jgi:hypothetical protein
LRKLFIEGVGMSYQIKHMGLGGILDQAIAIVRDNFVLLFTIMLLTLVPVILAQEFLEMAVTPELPPDPTLEERIEAQQAVMQYWPWFAAINLLNFIVALPLANAAVIQAIARRYLGQPVTAMQAISHGLKRLLPLLGTTILVYLAVWGGIILLIIPGIYFAIWFGLSQHVVVLEGIAGPKALGRSKRLVHKDRGTFLALFIVLFVITIMLTMGVEFIPQPHLHVFGSALIQALVTMVWTAAFVVFYFSCRCNVENFDLHYLADTIRVEDPEAPQVPAYRSAT